MGGSPTGERVEAPQTITCNTNTGEYGVRIDPPPGAQIDGDSGVKKSLGGLNPPNPPANRTLHLLQFLSVTYSVIPQLITVINDVQLT